MTRRDRSQTALFGRGSENWQAPQSHLDLGIDKKKPEGWKRQAREHREASLKGKRGKQGTFGTPPALPRPPGPKAVRPLVSSEDRHAMDEARRELEGLVMHLERDAMTEADLEATIEAAKATVQRMKAMDQDRAAEAMDFIEDHCKVVIDREIRNAGSENQGK